MRMVGYCNAERDQVGSIMNRRESLRVLAAGLAGFAFTGKAVANVTAKPRMTVYKSPSCGCCKSWVKHVRDHGFDVEAIDVDDVTPYKTKYGVPADLASCHTGVVNGYVFEGHVPADLITKLLREKPKDAKGLAVPGMPMGSPGMEMGDMKDAYDVVLFGAKGSRRVYARR